MKSNIVNKTFLILSNTGGSIGRFYRGIGMSLINKGHEVIFVAQGNKENTILPEGCSRLLHWPSDRPVHFRDGLFLYKLVRKYKPDIIIANFGATSLGLVVGFLCKVKKRIVWYHTATTQMGRQSVADKLKMLRLKLIYGLSTGFLCATRYIADDLRAVFQIKKPIRILPYLCQDFIGNNKSKKLRQILFVGRFHESKNQKALIEALPYIIRKFPEVKAVFVGQGPTLNDCKEKAGKLNMLASCDFFESKSLIEVREFMANSALHVTASFAEGFGLVVTEAMSVGTPVLVSDIPTFREIIRDGEDGLFFDPKNPQDLANKAITILSNPGLLERMSMNARKHFEEKFSLERNVEKYAEIFENLCS